MKSIIKVITVFTLLLSLSGCQSAYYAAMEKVGQHKRDILVSRVEEANESQQEAQQQFTSALAHLSDLIAFDGGDLSEHYQISKSQYENSAAVAEEVSQRISAIENVSSALFDEWQEEIDQFSNLSLKRQSQRKYRETNSRYQSVIRAMHNAEKRMSPVLAALKDNTLYLKHNLNAQAVGALQGEYKNIKQDVELLIKEMNQAIDKSQSFIDQLQL
jgi:hypothetical protein